MSAASQACLPYGLSKRRLQKRGKGESRICPYGICARWRIPSLRELSEHLTTPPQTTPLDVSVFRPRTQDTPLLEQLNMGVKSQKPRRTHLQAFARRHSHAGSSLKTKGVPQRVTMFPIPKRAPVKDLQNEMYDDEESSGNTKETPIIVPDDDTDMDSGCESDDSMDVESTSNVSTSTMHQQAYLPSPSSSLWSPSHKTNISDYGLNSKKPGRFPQISYPTPPASSVIPLQERKRMAINWNIDSSEDDSPQTIPTAKAKRRLSRPKSGTPGPSKYDSREQATRDQVRSRTPFSKKPGENQSMLMDGHGSADMVLADVQDQDMREKLARLIKVAPGLPVRDLYGFLIDHQGGFEEARRHALRASTAPMNQQFIKAEPLSYDNTTRHTVDPATYSGDDDEVMVKIDLNDSAFEWDEDSPPPEPPKKKKSRPAQHSGKAESRAKRGVARNQAKCPSSGSISVIRRKRDRSIERFIVPDNVMHLATDSSSSSSSNHDTTDDTPDTDAEMQHTVPEDLANLRINMRKKYAYNARLLARQDAA